MMKALQLVKPGVFELVEINVPRLLPEGKDLVLIRTLWVSLCGSDVPFFVGNKRSATYPLAPGAPIHECVGEVVESQSERFRPGDRVLAIPEGNQGLAEYFVAQASKTVLLSPALNDLAPACLIQPLATVINAIDRLGNLRGRSTAVMGLGSMGLMFCWLLAQRGAASILGIDPCEDRCRRAETLGATRTICRKGVEVVHESRVAPARWQAPDIIIEAVGHQTDTINDCLELVRKYGIVVAFGVPDHPVYALQYEIFFRKNAQLVGTVTPEWQEYLAQAHELFLSHQETLAKLITHRMPIRETERAFRLYEKHEEGIVKAVLDARCW